MDLDLEGGVLRVPGKSQAEERVQLPSQARPALARLETALAPPCDDWLVIPTLHAPTLHGWLTDDEDVDEDPTVLAALWDRDEAPSALTTDAECCRTDSTRDGQHRPYKDERRNACVPAVVRQ